jgi:hypothetical protein
MRKLATAAFCLTVVSALGCGSKPSASTPDSRQSTPTPAAAATPKPKDLIVGKWEAVAPKEAAMAALVYEFKTDGRLRKSMNTGAMFPLIWSGQYTFLADDVIQIQMEPPPDFLGEKLPTPKAEKARVVVTRDELTLTPEADKTAVIKLKKKT